MMVLSPGADPIEVQWYFTDKPPLPFVHIGASRNWLSSQDEQTNPGEVAGAARPWVNGAGPQLPCCDEPRGTPEAWLGMPGQPTFASCQWAPYVGSIDLGLTPAGEISSPKIYQGTIALGLTPAGKITNPVLYRGSIGLALTPAGKKISPIFYTGSIPLYLTPAGVDVSPKFYHGAIGLALTPTGITYPGKKYTGAIDLGLTPAGVVVYSIMYTGAIDLDLTPAGVYSPPNPIINYGSCSGGMYSIWDLSVSGFTSFCAPMNGSYTLTFNPTTQTFESSATIPTGQPVWTMNFTGFPTFIWVLSGRIPGNIISWTGSLSSGSFVCLGNNTFPVSGSGSCPAFPSTLTVTPA